MPGRASCPRRPAGVGAGARLHLRFRPGGRMPVYLPPTSRRRFLAGSLATTAAVLFRDGLFGAGAVAADPPRFALLSDVHIAADRTKVSRGVNMGDNLAKVVAEVAALSPAPANAAV